MAKIDTIMQKNFKLVLRSRTSALIMLLGPILMMMIVGLALNTPAVERINIGYTFIDNQDLSEQFISQLYSNETKIIRYENIKECNKSIGTGEVHLCIQFPKDFRIENKRKNQIDFYIDNSKINIFRAVLDSIENKFNKKAQEVSAGLTLELLSKLNQTTGEIHNKSLIIPLLKEDNEKINILLNDTETALGGMQLSFSVNDMNLDQFDNLGDDFRTKMEKLERYAKQGIDRTEDLGREIERWIEEKSLIYNFSQQDLLEYEEIMNESDDDLDKLFEKINSTDIEDTEAYDDYVQSIKFELLNLDARLNDAINMQGVSITKIEELKAKNAESLTKIRQIEETFNAITGNIESTEVTSLDSIVKPIEKNIISVASEESQLNFYFPYLIVMIIMFIGILISSTLVNMEKTSKAYFRNFITPTKDSAFLFATFFTTMIFIAIQLIFVYLVFTFYFHKNIVDDFRLTIIITGLSATIFTLIGMLVGNLFNTQESSMLASISLSSMMLFISDLVFPLERMPEKVANAAKMINPFYVSSDLLRKTWIHKASIVDQDQQMIILVSIAGILIVLVWLSHIIIKKHFFLRFSGYMARRDIRQKLKEEDYMKIFTRMKSLPEKDYFMTNNKKQIRNIKELIDFIEKQPDKDFEKYVTKHKNIYADWVSKSIGNEPLAAVMYKTHRKRRILKALKRAQKEFEKFDAEQKKQHEKDKEKQEKPESK